MDVQKRLSSLPATPFVPYQQAIAREIGLHPRNLAESFIDVDGESLLDRLIALCRLAKDQKQPILFQ